LSKAANQGWQIVDAPAGKPSPWMYQWTWREFTVLWKVVGSSMSCSALSVNCPLATFPDAEDKSFWHCADSIMVEFPQITSKLTNF
jgi:hypothetical protein